jgi:hypothetical protein
MSNWFADKLGSDPRRSAGAPPKASRRLNMHRRTLQRILAKRAPR